MTVEIDDDDWEFEMTDFEYVDPESVLGSCDIEHKMYVECLKNAKTDRMKVELRICAKFFSFFVVCLQNKETKQQQKKRVGKNIGILNGIY